MKTDHSHKNELDKRAMKLIACFFCRGFHIDVYRDMRGKFFVRNQDKVTQRELTAEAIVRYLAHVANDK